MKKIILVLFFAFLLLPSCKKSSEKVVPEPNIATEIPTEVILEQAFLDDRIVLEEPLINQKVMSPLLVKGDARGTWFFEASFPVRLLDGNGVELAIAPATSSEPWMTTEFIPFEATLEFDTPSTETGTLVLEKDNPSGMPENAAMLEVPVMFN